jgi:uncharacterized protein (TIGR01777 family)
MATPGPRVVVPGGSGFLGQALAADLAARGYDVVVFTRAPAAWRGPGRAVAWDGRTVGDWASELDGSLAVVNLAGKNVNCRYTPANRREIVDSRVDSVAAVGAAIQRCARPPAVWLQAASLAIYGDAGDALCDEDAPPGRGFPVETCLAWERAFAATSTPATRRAVLRISFVLGRGNGALKVLTGLTRWFLGGTVGSGRQWVSWLHVADWNAVVRLLIERPDLGGVFNVTGPDPVTNADLMRALRRALGRPWSPPAPAPIVRLGALAMGTEGDLALTGRRGIPRRLEQAGFRFAFPDLDPALADLLGPPRR